MTYAGRFSGKRHVGMRWITVSIIFVIGASVSLAQLPTATILGAVRDASGAVIPGVSLTARNLETGQTRTAVTAGDGSYRFSALAVGSYEVRAEHSGFRSAVRMGLTLTVTQEAVVNFTLALGAIEQTVEVSAEAPLVNTTSGSLGGLVDSEKIADLPLNGRNYADLILLQTGIAMNVNKGTGAATLGTPYSSNGAPIYSNTYLMDGTSTVDFMGGTSASANGSTLGVDGIREYRVVTNSFSAEYGQSMGSQTVTVTKSGTNTFHGSLFEFLRNSALDARNFFDYETDITPGRLPPFKRNNFGGSFGGPIKKDKTFFFGVFEGLRERLGLTNLLDTMPASAKVDGGVGGVPQIAPVVKPFLPYFLEPNLPNNQRTYPYSQPSGEDYGQIRVDQSFSGVDTAFIRYTVSDGQIVEPGNWPGFEQWRESRNQYATLSENHIFSPTLLNTFRFSFTRTRRVQDALIPEQLIGPQYSFVPGEQMGGITVGGLTPGLGGGSNRQDIRLNLFAWSDDMFYTRGRHAMKFGILINHYQRYALPSQGQRGSITFANLTSFLLAQPSAYSAATPGSIFDRTYHNNAIGFYFQDDLRVGSNLTLNLGLRYEFYTTFQDVHNKTAVLRDIRNDTAPTIGPPFKNPSLRNFSPRFGFAWDVRGDGRTALRGGFGLLYDIANYGQVIRSGICAPPFCRTSSVSIPAPNPGTIPVTLTLPLFFPESAAGKAIKGLDYYLQQPHMLQYNLTVERQLPWAMALTLAYGGSRGINLNRYQDGNPKVPEIRPDGRKFWANNALRVNQNWDNVELHESAGDSWYNSLQFGLVKRMSNGLQFQSSYTWARAFNTVPQGQGTGESLQSAQYMVDPSDNLRERAPSAWDMIHNWRFNAIYRMPAFARAGGAMGKLLNGWGAAGILSAQTGYPFNPVITTNRSRSGVNGSGTRIDRPDIVRGFDMTKITSGTTAGCPGVAAGQKLGTQEMWYDLCAFTLQPAGFLGNAGRHILRGPGIFNLDFSFTKDTALGFLGESGNLQFRADFFNILNHVNFATPSLAAGSGTGNNPAAVLFAGRADGERPLATAGRITQTANTSRQIQLALRIVF